MFVLSLSFLSTSIEPARAQLTMMEPGFTVTNLGSASSAKQVECSPGGVWGNYVYMAASVYNIIERMDYADVSSLFATMPFNAFPVGLAFGPGPANNFGDFIYVADYGTSTIEKVDPAGVVTPFTTLSLATSTTFDPTGAYSTDLFAVTGYSGPIYTVDPSGVATVFAAVPSLYIKFGPGGAWGTGMYSTSQSAVGYVKVDALGNATNFCTGFTNPEGFDWATGTLFMGDMFAADVSTSEVWRIKDDGTRTLFASMPTAADVAFCNGAMYLVSFHGECYKVTEEQPVSVAFQRATATVVDGGVQLHWNVIADESIEGFDVQRAAAGVAIPASILGESDLPAAATGYLDTEVLPGTEYRYVVVAVTKDGEYRSAPITATVPATVFSARSYPNPFNPATTIEYTLSQPDHVTLAIYDVEGGLVRTLETGSRDVGTHTREWNGTDANGNPVASGTYFYRLTAGNRTLSHKVVLLK
ncbi:MAG TPA: FlgD immunoglobulin-like domain containing protein [Candidatus Krumholzibacteria bacterium]|nr:FlgD immunoglobulin-like domain containing protein [Candidatus Krumholzibacteria bacterium]